MNHNHITHVAVEPSFKGFRGTANLAPFLIIVGPNKAGKTSLLHTILAGFEGVTAGSAKRTAKAVEVQPVRLPVAEIPEGTTITLTLSSGATVDRLLTTGRKDTEHADALAAELIGRPLVDVRTLADSTLGQARANMAACLTAGGLVAGWDIATAAEQVERAMLARFGELEDGTTRTAWLAPLVEWRGKLPRNPVDGMEDDGGGWMTALCPLVEASVTKLSQAKTAADGAWRDAQRRPPQQPPQDRGKARADRDRAAVELARAADIEQAKVRHAAALAAWTTERDRLQGEVDRITAEGKQRRDALAALRDAPLPPVEPHLLDALTTAEAAPLPVLAAPDPLYDEAVTAARAAHDAPLPGPDAARLAELAAEIATTAAEIDKLREEQTARAVTTADAQAAVQVAGKARATAQAEADSAAMLLVQVSGELSALVNIHTDSACKTCGDVDPYGLAARADALRTNAAEVGALVTERKAAAQQAEQAHVDAKTAHASAEEAAQHVLTMRERSEQRVASLRAERARLTDPAADERTRASQQAALTAAEANRSREQARLTAEHSRATAEHAARIERARAAITGRQQQIASARAVEIADAESALVRMRTSFAATTAALASHSTPPVEPSADPVDADALTAEIARCVAIESAWTDYDSHLTRHRAAEAAAMRAGVEWAAATCLVRSLRLCIADLAATAVQPIQAAMDAVVADLPTEIGIRPYYLSASDFGVIQPTGETTRYRDCSGAEQIIVEASMGVALAALQGCPVPICTIDELARIQDDHIPGVVGALLRAMERGAVAQVICTMPLADDPEMAERRLALVRDIPGVTVLDVRAVIAANEED